MLQNLLYMLPMYRSICIYSEAVKLLIYFKFGKASKKVVTEKLKLLLLD